MEQMAEDLDEAIPSEEELFKIYFDEAKWDKYKQVGVLLISLIKLWQCDFKLLPKLTFLNRL